MCTQFFILYNFKRFIDKAHLLINSIHPLGVHGKNPDRSPIATRPSLIVFNLQLNNYTYIFFVEG